jgi:hypothetical protein
MIKRNYDENKMKKHIFSIIPIMVAFISLVPIGPSAFAQSEGEIFTDENGNKAIIFNGLKYTLDEDGKMTGEDGSCAYLNPESDTISPCEAPTDPDDEPDTETGGGGETVPPLDEGTTGDQGTTETLPPPDHDVEEGPAYELAPDGGTTGGEPNVQ